MTARAYSRNRRPATYLKSSSWREMRRRQIRRRFFLFSITVMAMTACIIFSLHAMAYQSESHSVSYKYYTSIEIQSGDTLWGLAQIYGSECSDDPASLQSYVDEVISINHMKDGDSIRAGQHLIIPYYSDQYVK